MKILKLFQRNQEDPNDFHPYLSPGSCWILSEGVHNMEKAILFCWLVLEEVENPWYVFVTKQIVLYFVSV